MKTETASLILLSCFFESIAIADGTHCPKNNLNLCFKNEHVPERKQQYMSDFLCQTYTVPLYDLYLLRSGQSRFLFEDSDYFFDSAGFAEGKT